jgi:hypothetical protein
MLPTIRAILAADATANALLAGRVYRHGSAPQNVARPYVTWSMPAGDADYTLDGPDADHARIQVDCWHDTDAGVEALGVAVRNALEQQASATHYIANERDPETQRFRIGFQFDWITSR